MKTPTWEKPGPGTWLLDSSHSGPALRIPDGATIEVDPVAGRVRVF